MGVVLRARVDLVQLDRRTVAFVVKGAPVHLVGDLARACPLVTSLSEQLRDRLVQRQRPAAGGCARGEPERRLRLSDQLNELLPTLLELSQLLFGFRESRLQLWPCLLERQLKRLVHIHVSKRNTSTA